MFVFVWWWWWFVCVCSVCVCTVCVCVCACVRLCESVCAGHVSVYVYGYVSVCVSVCVRVFLSASVCTYLQKRPVCAGKRHMIRHKRRRLKGTHGGAHIHTGVFQRATPYTAHHTHIHTPHTPHPHIAHPHHTQRLYPTGPTHRCLIPNRTLRHGINLSIQRLN